MVSFPSWSLTIGAWKVRVAWPTDQWAVISPHIILITPHPDADTDEQIGGITQDVLLEIHSRLGLEDLTVPKTENEA